MSKRSDILNELRLKDTVEKVENKKLKKVEKSS